MHLINKTMKVTWDRLFSWEYGWDEYDRVSAYEWEVVSYSRSMMWDWLMLVACTDWKFREASATEVKVIK